MYCVVIVTILSIIYHAGGKMSETFAIYMYIYIYIGLSDIYTVKHSLLVNML